MILGKQRNVLVVPNHRIVSIRRPLNFDDIESISGWLPPLAQAPEIIRTGAQHHSLLGFIDRMVP